MPGRLEPDGEFPCLPEGRRRRTRRCRRPPRRREAPLRTEDLGRPAPRRPNGPAAKDDAAETDLRHLVDAVRGAASEVQVPSPRSPWLPALPELLVAEDLPAASSALAASFGVVDVPERQRGDGLEFDLETAGHLYVVGAPRSGRSQVLRTLAARLADRVPTADLHLYGLDCGGGALPALAGLPHTGAIVQRSETDRAVRLLSRLREEVLRRQGELGELGVADVTEQRAAS